MVIGGQAVLLYGEPRLTKDIDITLGIGIERLSDMKDLVDRLSLKYLTKDADAFARDTMVLPVIDSKSGIRVDFIFSNSTYERQAIERSRVVSLGRARVKFSALEDVIIHKLIAERPRDMEDVQSILLKNPEYDLAYLRKWLKEFDAALGKDYLKTLLGIQNKLK
jgi:hypothetical protein